MRQACAIWVVERVERLKERGYDSKIVAYWTGPGVGHIFTAWQESGEWFAADDKIDRKSLRGVNGTARGLAEAFNGAPVSRAKFEYT